MKDYLQKAYCMNQTVRIYAAITTDICKEAKNIFNLWPSSLQALGRTLTIGAIMSCTYKSGEFLNIKLDCDGPVGKITVEATDGKVRGFCQNPGVLLQYNDGRLNIEHAVGAGTIEVVKDLHMRAPFSSSCEIVSGDIAQDFTYYFAKSEQIPSSVGLGVSIDDEGNVLSAGGFLIQVMPGCKEEYIKALEDRLKTMKPCTEMIKEGYNPEEIINEITGGDYQILETKELKYECSCNRERFEKGLISLGKDTLTDILNQDHKLEITCNFCNKKYNFDENQIKELIFKCK